LAAFFGREQRLRFVADPVRAARLATASGRNLLIWAGKEAAPLDCPRILRIEDGFLRSRGLGAELVPPLSLIADDLGIYYDPTRPSALEKLIQSPLPPGGRRRAEKLVAQLRAARLCKYNLGGAGAEGLPEGRRILVPGQVEDDASIRLGAGEVRTNLDLLRAARAANPDARLIYKPHPDVEAGLRPGVIAQADLAGLADHIADHADTVALIEACDEVWTMTSLLGFEALLRGKTVTVLGAPFYAGWGLTRDLGPVPARRRQAPDGHPLPRPDLIQLAHATLIAYPHYFDPISRRPCPPEVAAERLATGTVQKRSLRLRLLAKLQGAFAGQSWLWR
jgi:capsular polysaccharide export protein